MAYYKFLKDLLADGRVTVPEFSPLEDHDVAAGDQVIAEYERQNRLEMPGSAPRFVAATSRWAGIRFFRACQFVVHRDIGVETLIEELSVPYGEPVSPDVHYSVDLIFRFLPDVAKLTSGIAENDPLLDHLEGWARQWPLSSVGMPGVDDAQIRGFEDNASLMRLYADRIIARNDKLRLSHKGARHAVRAALGMFPDDLAAGISDALLQYDQAHDGDPEEAVSDPT